MTLKNFIMLLCITVVLLSCDKKLTFDSPLDPANDHFKAPQSPISNRVIITDFEGDPNLSVWNLQHYVFGFRGGDIIRTFIDEEIDGNVSTVMQLDYEVSPDSSFSGGTWFQLLAHPTHGPFNAQVLGLTSLSFYARGAEGGEIVGVSFSVGEKTTEPHPGRALTNKWAKYKITFSELIAGSIDLKKLETLNFHFGENPDKGRVLIDEIAFEWD